MGNDKENLIKILDEQIQSEMKIKNKFLLALLTVGPALLLTLSVASTDAISALILLNIIFVLLYKNSNNKIDILIKKKKDLF